MLIFKNKEKKWKLVRKVGGIGPKIIGVVQARIDIAAKAKELPLWSLKFS